MTEIITYDSYFFGRPANQTYAHIKKDGNNPNPFGKQNMVWF